MNEWMNEYTLQMQVKFQICNMHGDVTEYIT